MFERYMIEKDILEKTRNALRDFPNQWTHGAMARDVSGKKVNYDDPNACKWCAFGMIAYYLKGRYPDVHDDHLYFYSSYLDKIVQDKHDRNRTFIGLNDVEPRAYWSDKSWDNNRLKILEILDIAIERQHAFEEQVYELNKSRN